MSSATEELRRLLDERGVEYETCDEPSMWYTCWRLAGDDMMNACFEEINGLIPSFYIRYATPEQAIAVTLGPGTCQADETDTWECVCDGIGHYGVRMTIHVMECSECGRTYEHVNGDYEYCPHCGRRVVEVAD